MWIKTRILIKKGEEGKKTESTEKTLHFNDQQISNKGAKAIQKGKNNFQ